MYIFESICPSKPPNDNTRNGIKLISINAWNDFQFCCCPFYCVPFIHLGEMYLFCVWNGWPPSYHSVVVLDTVQYKWLLYAGFIFFLIPSISLTLFFYFCLACFFSSPPSISSCHQSWNMCVHITRRPKVYT